MSVLLVEETVVPGQNHRPVGSHWQSLSLREWPFNFYGGEGVNILIER
jgi:hypothetical protein